MKAIVLSDLHIGTGFYHEDGKRNILEDFEKDEEFAELLEFYSEGDFYDEKIHLILNGDIFNFIQIPYDGEFTHLITEEKVVDGVDRIYQGHKKFFEALRLFARRPNKKIFYVIGNHDHPIVFKKAQERFNYYIDHEAVFSFSYYQNGLYIEHGHRFDYQNNFTRPVTTYNGEKIANLPWGSLFVLYLLPELKKHRPYIDKVRPLSLYIKNSFFNDTRFFFYMCWQVIWFVLRTQTKKYILSNPNFRMHWDLLRKMSVNCASNAYIESLFKEKSKAKVIVVGHSHIAEWRRLDGGKVYVNSGTWNDIPSLDIGKNVDINKKSYVFLDIDEENEKIRRADLLDWKGTWKPYQVDSSIQYE